MKEEMNTTKPARAKDLASLLRSPLVIFGLILLAGDGPLLIAYLLTSNPVHKGILLGALLVFILGMGAVFCYLVIYKPRNLYPPGDIPQEAIGKSLYLNHEPATATAAIAKIAAREQDKEPESPSTEVLKTVINNLTEHLCWFLLKAANKNMEIVDEFSETIIKEAGLYDYAYIFDPAASAFGYYMALHNFDGLLFDFDIKQSTVIYKLSPEALDLIQQRLIHSGIANSS